MRWDFILRTLRESFAKIPTKLIICLGQIQIPPFEKRKEIMDEAHSSALGGHKGITKTYGRIRQRYYWENMKTDVQN